MRTLDEVIKVFTKCFDNTYNIVPLECEPEYGEDALQYLKWYKELADDSEAFAEWKENPPLTWDELKQMYGKPVWVEDTYCKFYGWEIVKRLGTNRWMTGEFLETNGGLYRKEDQGESWQAYRKERK